MESEGKIMDRSLKKVALSCLLALDLFGDDIIGIHSISQGNIHRHQLVIPTGWS